MGCEMIRWGIIGCGNVTEVKSGPALQNARDSRLVAVMRRDGELARDYAQRHGVPKWYDDAQALIDDPDVNAIYVATPPSTHRQFALMSIRAGKPVYVEKPMALDHAECEEMVRASEQHGVPLFIAYYRRMLPRFLRIRELLFDQGVIGQPRLVNVVFHATFGKRYQDREHLPWHVRPEISGGGLFVDVGCHTLDLLDDLFGPIAAVSGHAGSQLHAYPAEDTVSMSFAFGSGVQGSGVWNFCSFKDHDSVEVIGDQGRITFATFGDGPILVENGQGVQEYALQNPLHIQQPLVETIVAELTGRGTCPSTGVSAARTTWVIDQVLGEYRRNAVSGRDPQARPARTV